MNAALLAPEPVFGDQRPRIISVPPFVSSSGADAIELCAMAGLDMDVWQQFALYNALGERPDGMWAAFEFALVVSRQNGKGGFIEARELTGLFLLGERLIIHSAHLFDTSLEAFRRLLHLIESTPDFDRRVKRVSRAHGEEGIELKGGQRIRFRTRTSGGGRGFTGDCLILDEAMYIPESAHGALIPTLSAVPNPQVIYAGSAVDEQIHDHGIVLTRLRNRALAGGDPSLAYMEWSVDREQLEKHPELAADPRAHAQANPALGIRISEEYIFHEKRSMSARTFEVERLGAGFWPSTDGSDERVISEETFRDTIDLKSRAIDPVCFSFDVTPDRSKACISAAGARADGGVHMEVIKHDDGTGWVVARLGELRDAHKPAAIIADERGPAASLLPQLEKLGIEVVTVSYKEYAQACAMTYDGLEQRSTWHLGTQELAAAAAGAVKRPLGDSWAWSRKSSAVDITPIVSCSLAVWGHATQEKPKFDLSAYRIRRV